MAVLTQVQDILTARTLYAFEKKPKSTRFDQSWQRRTGSYTLLGHDFGVNPYGTYAAPMGIRKLTWTFRVVVAAGGDLDAAAATVNRAMAKRRQHLLVRSFSGHEQVVGGQVVDFQDITASSDNWRHRDFQITWELLDYWRDRATRGPHRIGDTAGVALNFTALVMGLGSVALTQNPQNFTLIADGSDGEQAPTVDDTGPTITLVGPYGADSGIAIAQLTGAVADDLGSIVAPYFAYSQHIPAGSTLVIDCGALSATLDGVDVWANVVVPDYQPFLLSVEAGIVNTYQIAAVGANVLTPTSASKLTVAWEGLYQ